MSIGGLTFGAFAAAAYGRWESWPFTVAGLLLSVGWLAADGLDGMIARATDTSSRFGRTLDGLCDHGVFGMIYIVLAWSIGTVEGWALGFAAAAFHAVQSNLYEAERARFQRRCKGAAIAAPLPIGNPFVGLYDHVARSLDRSAFRFDQALQRHEDRRWFVEAYGGEAARPMRLMSLLTANVRVLAIFLACLAGNPSLFWWFEIGPLTIILVVGLVWHRSVETRLLKSHDAIPRTSSPIEPSMTKGSEE